MVQSCCFVPGCITGYNSDRKRCKEKGEKAKSLFRAPRVPKSLLFWTKVAGSPDMVVSTCFVPGCTTGYTSDRKLCKEKGEKVKSLFSPPHDEELLRKWRFAIRRKDRILTPKDCLCEKHFTEDCIIRTYEQNLPDGSVWKYDRGIKRLKPGAIPTIFEYSSNTTFKKKRKPKKSTAQAFMQSINHKMESIPNVPNFIASGNEEIAPIHSDPTDIDSYNQKIAPIHSDPTYEDSENAEIVPIPVEDKFLAYEAFLSELDAVVKPNDLWAISHNSNFIICGKWDCEGLCERSVIISKDFSVKIFLRNQEIPISDVVMVKDIEDLSDLLMKVDKWVILENL